MQLIHADLDAVKEARTKYVGKGFYRSIKLSEGYDSPYKGAIVAEVYDGSDHAEFEESELDALLALFTAAPDMLAALKKAQAHMSITDDECSITTERAINNAIRKATT